MRGMSKPMFQVAVAASIIVSAAAVCWLAFNLLGYIIASAFASAPRGATAWIVLWLGCAGTALALTWGIVASYRRAFPRQERKA